MIRITIFEDNDPLRQLLAAVLNASNAFTLAGAYPDATDILNDLKQEQPDMVLMDIDMPGVSGLQALKMIKQFNPVIKVVMHTVFEDNDKIFESICAGADGYLLKSATEQELLQSLLQVHAGGAIMTPSVARKVLTLFAKFAPAKKGEEYNLSDREKDVLRLLIKGYSYKMVAAELNLAVETIRTYIKRMYEKLQVHSMSAAVAKALKEGLV
ncbi:response regulator transcription factor [Niastella caeni]|uniref:Response regulator transcription factor n=1 Tax=Niastella caeni TaxID=2569763 RepID=A0A4S8HIA4_9BACT|nr:response regulator transcription factor [Niastella caeni]THU34940.1 response regulator transcription factor [Niastella caeni]